MGGSVVSLWYAAAAGCTAWICYTDIRRCWIADAPVLALAVATAPPVMPVWSGPFGPFPWASPPSSCSSMVSGPVPSAAATSSWPWPWRRLPGLGAWTMAVTSFGLAALVALFYRFRTGKTIIPFGPFLLAGWWLAQEPLQRAWPGGWLW